MTWMTWRSEATLIALLASTTRCTSSSPISWSGRATATTPVEFCDQRCVPARETTTDSMRWPAIRSAVTAAAWMAAIVLSRVTTTPLRRPSEGLSPTPMTLTGAPGSSRSEEHTSELQSHVNLVCRLLLEKKKKKNNQNTKTKKKQKKIT